jgi:5-methylcytosine-specific restriction endonuclease McrA
MGLAAQRKKAWSKTNGYCWYCGIALHPFGDFCIEHGTPKARNGTNDDDNLLPSCRRCNNRKRHRTIEEFREYLTRNAIPKLTEEQLAYLTAIGVQLPAAWPTPPRHVFWAEQ